MILTDVTQVWLDLRNALQGAPFIAIRRWDSCSLRVDLAVDYDKIAGRYSRSFLWTSWEFYTPATRMRERAARAYIESCVGPFQVVSETLPAQSAAVPASA